MSLQKVISKQVEKSIQLNMTKECALHAFVVWMHSTFHPLHVHKNFERSLHSCKHYGFYGNNNQFEIIWTELVVN